MTHRPSRRRSLLVILLSISVVIAIFASLAIGARAIPIPDVIAALTNYDPSNNNHLVVVSQRLPRTLIAILAGVALAVAGTLMQGLTRNPLADPGLLGLNGGASLAVLISIVVLGWSNPHVFVWAAFVGSGLAAVLVYSIAARGGTGANPITLALTGAALTAGLTSISMFILTTDQQALNNFRFWSVGSLTGRGLDTVAAVLPMLLAGLILAIASTSRLNALALGDQLAQGLGYSLTTSRLMIIGATVLLSASATAMAGPIVFLGLVVPHLLRSASHGDYRWLVALAAPAGATLLLVADTVGRVIALPGEVEAGFVAAFIGAPIMMWIIQGKKSVSV
ncbi:FecCD family ABC transporter permease [Jonesia quinghaiensis]|uniref:FecCD family ABC transporter permease n=1 Tax=Jonesia quinghaiensis TaxID=262806 RepID=UPI0003FA4388|nr:iron ABC transporter permease [Jonesia quinghaiensis]